MLAEKCISMTDCGDGNYDNDDNGVDLIVQRPIGVKIPTTIHMI